MIVEYLQVLFASKDKSLEPKAESGIAFMINSIGNTIYLRLIYVSFFTTNSPVDICVV